MFDKQTKPSNCHFCHILNLKRYFFFNPRHSLKQKYAPPPISLLWESARNGDVVGVRTALVAGRYDINARDEHVSDRFLKERGWIAVILKIGRLGEESVRKEHGTRLQR